MHFSNFYVLFFMHYIEYLPNIEKLLAANEYQIPSQIFTVL